MDRPPYWQLIKEAIASLGGRATYTSIIEYIKAKYPDAKESTIRAQIIICTVNAPSRTHYPENKKPRKATDERYDFLFSVGQRTGEVIVYNPELHGQWSIVMRDGRLEVTQEGTVDEVIEGPLQESEAEDAAFPMESHLRDFLAKNLGTVEKGLKLYLDENGREGIEYRSATGPIDILATDENGNFVVFELKLARGPDKAFGQLNRYMGWVSDTLAKGKEVRGFIVAKSIDDGLRYAAKMCKNVKLLEYEVKFAVKAAELIPR